MKRIFPLFFLILLAGCASVGEQYFNQGVSLHDNGSYGDAAGKYQACMQSNPHYSIYAACANNFALLTWEGHVSYLNKNAAVKYWEIAARYGNETARRNLLQFGYNAPPTDPEILRSRREAYEALGGAAESIGALIGSRLAK